jgi:tetratricopeptide (TPR) repeat protein
MVGRERELAALAAAWDHGRVPAVTGEAGMGKSRLLSDFTEPRQGTERAAGRPGDGDVPFATLARLLRSVAAARPPVLDPATQSELARVLPELGTASASFPEGRRLHLQNALAAFLKAAPGLQGLVLDDLHFADTATLEVLPALIGETQPLRWALAYRPAEAGTPVKVLENALIDGMNLVPIAVAPLDEPALAQLVDQLDLGVAGTAVAGELQRRTGGNPLFVLETLKQAWVDDGVGRLGEGGALTLPGTVGQLIDRRIGLLSAQALALARVASIASIDFSISLAESVLGIKAILLTDAVNELESAQVLKGVQFAHDLVFDAVRRALPPAIARHAHAGVAQWLETVGGEPARIAMHWIEGGSPAGALRWLGLAAEKARQALRSHEALAFLEQRAGIEAELGLRAQAFATQLELVKSSILLEPARERTEGRIDTLARYADSEAQHCRVSMERVHAAGTHNDDLRAAALAEETLLRATRCGETEIVMQCHLALTSASTRARQLPAALAHAQACRAWVEQFGSQERQMELHAYLGSIYGQLGPLADAVFHHERAIELGRSLGRMHDCATALFNLAQTLSGCGQSMRALPLAEEVARIERAHESPPTYAAATQALLTVTHTRLGHYASALRAAAVGRQLLETPGVVPRLKESLAQFEAQCWLHLGQRARALTLINAGLAVASVPYFRAHWLRLRFTAAQMHGAVGPDDLVEALALFSDASTIVHMDLQLLRAALLPASEALDLLGHVRAMAQRSDHGAQLLLSHLHAARLLLTDDSGRAAEHAAQAWQLASQHDLGFTYRGKLYLHCARAFMASGDERRGHQVIAAGQTWLADTVAHELPPDCRESFLHRNPCNAALAVLAASVGART